MKLILGVCVLFAVAWDQTTGAAFGERKSPSTMSPYWTRQRTLRATGDGQTGNMTVAFVPLISIIANLLPRFFTRYGTAQPSNVQQARSFNEQTPGMKCLEPMHVGLKWPDEVSRSHYYQCHLLKHCSSVYKASCLVKKLKKCKPRTVFDFDKQQCSSLHL